MPLRRLSTSCETRSWCPPRTLTNRSRPGQVVAAAVHVNCPGGEPYELRITPEGLGHLDQLPDKICDAALATLNGPIRDDPRRLGKPLMGELAGLFSARRGDYRIIYSIDEPTKTVICIASSVGPTSTEAGEWTTTGADWMGPQRGDYAQQQKEDSRAGDEDFPRRFGDWYTATGTSCRVERARSGASVKL